MVPSGPDLYDEQPPKDACGVFGVWAPGEDVAKLTYFGLYALQHRGQEAAGIAVSDGSTDRRLQGPRPGRRRSSTRPTLAALERAPRDRPLPLLHHRLRAPGRTPSRPTVRSPHGGGIALGHNGNLTNTAAAVADRRSARLDPTRGRAAEWPTTDSDLITALLAGQPRPRRSRRRRSRCCRSSRARSRSSSWTSTRCTPPATRTASARWCSAGSSAAGWSPRETAALDIVGASFVREVEPGELVAIDEHGLRSQRFAEATPKGCLFEYVYLARPDTTIAGRSRARDPRRGRPPAGPRGAGRGRPGDPGARESGTPAAIGYAEASGIPYGTGLVKNAYVGRTFIQPSQTIRQLGIRLKLNPLREVIEGKRLVVVDDSIVRGNTQRALVRMLREAGARRGARAHLVAAGEVAVLLRHRLRLPRRAHRQRPGRRRDPRVDRRRLARLRLARRARSRRPTHRQADELCRACFDGEYPIDLPDPELLGKHMLESIAEPAAGDGRPGRRARDRRRRRTP